MQFDKSQDAYMHITYWATTFILPKVNMFEMLLTLIYVLFSSLVGDSGCHEVVFIGALLFSHEIRDESNDY